MKKISLACSAFAMASLYAHPDEAEHHMSERTYRKRTTDHKNKKANERRLRQMNKKERPASCKLKS